MAITTLQAESISPPLVARAKAALNGPGIVILRDAVEREVLRDAGHAIVEQLCSLDGDAAKRDGVRVGGGRYMVTLDWTPPFNKPALFANPALIAIARATLGIDVIINSLTVVIAMPGAETQRPHVDHAMLFPSDEASSMAVPPYALTAIVPLLDLNTTTGSTEVWPREPLMATPDLWEKKLPGSTVLPLSLGDAGVIDYRVCHGGTPNIGPIPRPILYIVYSRPWFRDAENFSEIPPLRITASQLAEIPRQYRSLFASAAAGHLE